MICDDADAGGADAGGADVPFGCAHYRRRCRLVAPCCNKAYWCRICHDEAEHDACPAGTTEHTIDRKAVTELVCAPCGLRQAVAAACAACGTRFGAYACLECRLFDDDTGKQQFHCDECGICRVGGRDNFAHCDTCGSCMSGVGHVCVADNLRHNCAVCVEPLFESTRPVSSLPCGHTMHAECMREMLRNGAWTCPMCQKAMLPPDALRPLWRSIAAAIEETPMPDEARYDVDVLCNECGARSRQAFHVVGYRCDACEGYNTRRT